MIVKANGYIYYNAVVTKYVTAPFVATDSMFKITGDWKHNTVYADGSQETTLKAADMDLICHACRIEIME